MENIQLRKEFGIRESIQSPNLSDLEFLPAFCLAAKIDLSRNSIADGLKYLKNCFDLKSLNLSYNKINDLATVEPLKDIMSLSSLHLTGNEVTNLESYREKVFELIPQLKYLDGKDRYNEDEYDTENEID